VTDAEIHRVSRDAIGFVCSLPSSQWIATGFRPRDDKMKGKDVGGSVTSRSMSLRGKSEARDAAIHYMQ
jgi:hypothetical protein